MAEKVEVLTVVTDTDEFVLRGRPCELSAFSYIPTKRTKHPKERSYFNSDQKVHYPGSRYDRLFTQKTGYNNKLHRDDRDHAKLQGLAVHEEEIQKNVPTLSSSIYGHRLSHHIDQHDRKHVHVGHVKSEFYRRNGISFTSGIK